MKGLFCYSDELSVRADNFPRNVIDFNLNFVVGTVQFLFFGARYLARLLCSAKFNFKYCSYVNNDTNVW